MDAYEAYLVANAAQISSIEGVLRTLAYILPGKGRNSGRVIVDAG